jgi:DNA-directed RNA polymerase subunit H (RpoH/RPB5)
MTQNDLISQIQKSKYIIQTAVQADRVSSDEDLKRIKKYVSEYNEKSKKDDMRVTYIVISYINTEIESKRSNVVKLINHIRYPNADAIIITPNKMNSSIRSYITDLSNTSEHRTRTFRAYTYALLKTVLPKYELVPEYRILSDDDKAELEKHYQTYADLPRIFDSDPQMVWIGAKVGDIVEYKYSSEITIHGIGYCSVVEGDV